MNILRLIASIIIVSVATWLIVMPIYEWLGTALEGHIYLSLILGFVIIIFAVKYLKLRF